MWDRFSTNSSVISVFVQTNALAQKSLLNVCSVLIISESLSLKKFQKMLQTAAIEISVYAQLIQITNRLWMTESKQHKIRQRSQGLRTMSVFQIWAIKQTVKMLTAILSLALKKMSLSLTTKHLSLFSANLDRTQEENILKASFQCLITKCYAKIKRLTFANAMRTNFTRLRMGSLWSMTKMVQWHKRNRIAIWQSLSLLQVQRSSWSH